MHERKSFFKYTSAEIARTIMEEGRLRWSSPIRFNDPFDVVRELAEGIKPSDIQECMIEATIELIDSKGQIPDGLNPWAAWLVRVIRQSNDSTQKQELIDTLRETELIQRSEGLEELRAVWRDLVPDLRILCLSEENDIARMWKHYANEYKGIVFEFACNDELDSACLLAEKVIYVDGYPMLSDAKEWAKLFMLTQAAATKLVFHQSTYTKTNDWSYEKEWRVLDMKKRAESGDFSYREFHKDELKSIYLGPRIKNEYREQIVALRDKLYPKATILEGSICGGNRITFKHIV